MKINVFACKNDSRKRRLRLESGVGGGGGEEIALFKLFVRTLYTYFRLISVHTPYKAKYIVDLLTLFLPPG